MAILGTGLLVSGLLFFISPNKVLHIRDFLYITGPLLAGILIVKVVEIVVGLRKNNSNRESEEPNL